MADVAVTVMLTADADLDIVEANLVRAGLRSPKRLGSIKAFNGTVDTADLPQLNSVPHVLTVSVSTESTDVKMPLLDSDIQ